MASGLDLCAIPGGVSPDGVYNFVDPPSLGPAVLAVGISLAVVSSGFVIGRLYKNRHKLHAADYFTLMGWVFNIAYTGVICCQFRYYRHSWDIPVCWYDGRYLRLPFVQTILFFPVFFFTKAAIFLLYRQVFAVYKHIRIGVTIGLVITLLLYLTEIPLAAIYAAPRPGQSWDDLLLSLQANERPFATGGSAQSAVGTVLDLYIFILPLPTLARLRLQTARKWQLIGVFSTAVLGVAASVVSLVYKIEILSSTDSNWLAAITSICSLIETNIALIVGCMPAFAQFVKIHVGESSLLKTLRERLLWSRRSGGSSNKNGYDEQPRKLKTFGSNQTPRRRSYHELTTNNLLLDTQASTLQGSETESNRYSKPEAAHFGHERTV